MLTPGSSRLCTLRAGSPSAVGRRYWSQAQRLGDSSQKNGPLASEDSSGMELRDPGPTPSATHGGATGSKSPTLLGSASS